MQFSITIGDTSKSHAWRNNAPDIHNRDTHRAADYRGPYFLALGGEERVMNLVTIRTEELELSAEKMTHDDLCLRADRYLRSNGFGVSFNDRFRAYSGTGELPDAIGFRNGVSCLIEVKCSRSDFHADKKKHFRIKPETGMGDWRFFMCEPGIIEVSDLPVGWGLLHVKGNRVLKVHGWPPNSWWFSQKPFTGNKQAECDFMYSALRRMVVRGHFSEIYDGLPRTADLVEVKNG